MLLAVQLLFFVSLLWASIARETCTDPNATYSTCGAPCPETCANFQDPNRVCTRQCGAGCFCNNGYVLSEENSGQCVLYSQCPQATCPVNEVFKDCRTLCPAQTCAPPLYECLTPVPCLPGCDCIEGFLRNRTDSDGICIPSSSCPANDTNHITMRSFDSSSRKITRQ